MLLLELYVFVLAAFTRGKGFRKPGSMGVVAPLVAGLSFGWAGLLLHSAIFRTVYLPWLPAVVTPIWLLVGAVICWMAGRGLLAREAR